jgi:hypothetical protein
MKNFVALCICAFTLLACGMDESQKTDQKAENATTAQQTASQPQNAGASTMTDAQVFAYILGNVYGLPLYMNTPQRIGAMLDLDAMIQGVVDNERALKDSTWQLQLSAEEQKKVNEHYEKVAAERKTAGDSASSIALAGPITGQKVVITDTTSMIVKYSYAEGVMIDNLFNGMRENFGEPFEAHFFIQGVREFVYAALDPSFKKAVSDDRLKAVNLKYKKRMDDIREERRRQ